MAAASGMTVDPVALTVAALQGAAVLLLLRPRTHPLERPGPLAYLCIAPSMAIGVIALRAAPSSAQWPALPLLMFVTGAIWAMTSLAWLGRSFAIVPAARDLVTTGPYRLVRHPAYLGEAVMTSSCAAAAVATRPMSAALALSIVLGALALSIGIGWRIRVEERMVSVLDGWHGYTDRTPHRLVPGIW